MHGVRSGIMDSTPHPTIDWSSPNLKAAWKRFKQHCELMFSGPLSGKSEAVKCSYLLIWVGEKGRDIFNTWNLTAEENNKIRVYMDKFNEHVQPSANPIFGRFIFHKRNQNEGETVEGYTTELKLLALDCEFGDTADDMIRDRLVFGVKNDRIREKLLSEGGTLKLARAIQISRAIETVQETQAQMNLAGKPPCMKQEIEAVRRVKSKTPLCYLCGGL